MDEKTLLPYLVIARINGLVKENPGDDKVWLDKDGTRYVLTPKGFMPPEQYSGKEFEKYSRENDALVKECRYLKKKLEKARIDFKEILGKKSRKYVLKIINSDKFTDAEKVAEVKAYLKD